MHSFILHLQLLMHLSTLIKVPKDLLIRAMKRSVSLQKGHATVSTTRRTLEAGQVITLKASQVRKLEVLRVFKFRRISRQGRRTRNEEAIQKLRLELSKERRISRQPQTEVTSLRLRLNVWEQAFKMLAAKVKSDAASPGKTLPPTSCNNCSILSTCNSNFDFRTILSFSETKQVSM